MSDFTCQLLLIYFASLNFIGEKFVSLLRSSVELFSWLEIKLYFGIHGKMFASCKVSPREKLLSSFLWWRSFLLLQYRPESVLTRTSLSDRVLFTMIRLFSLVSLSKLIVLFQQGMLFDAMMFIQTDCPFSTRDAFWCYDVYPNWLSFFNKGCSLMLWCLSWLNFCFALSHMTLCSIILFQLKWLLYRMIGICVCSFLHGCAM